MAQLMFRASFLMLHFEKVCKNIVDSGPVAYYNAYFGRGSGPYHLDNVYCSGTETSLLSCNRRYSIGVHDCRPGNEAGVKCVTGE